MCELGPCLSSDVNIECVISFWVEAPCVVSGRNAGIIGPRAIGSFDLPQKGCPPRGDDQVRPDYN